MLFYCKGSQTISDGGIAIIGQYKVSNSSGLWSFTTYCKSYCTSWTEIRRPWWWFRYDVACMGQVLNFQFLWSKKRKCTYLWLKMPPLVKFINVSFGLSTARLLGNLPLPIHQSKNIFNRMNRLQQIQMQMIEIYAYLYFILSSAQIKL
jgi:hypothetical protein